MRRIRVVRAVAADAPQMLEAEAKARQKAGGGDRRSVRAIVPEPIEDAGRARDHAAKVVGVSARYVEDAKAIKREATMPEIEQDVEARASKATTKPRRKPGPAPALLTCGTCSRTLHGRRALEEHAKTHRRKAAGTPAPAPRPRERTRKGAAQAHPLPEPPAKASRAKTLSPGAPETPVMLPDEVLDPQRAEAYAAMSAQGPEREAEARRTLGTGFLRRLAEKAAHEAKTSPDELLAAARRALLALSPEARKPAVAFLSATLAPD